MTRVFAIMAHPDDAEIWSGGTLYRHAQRGDQVDICSLTYTPETTRGREGTEGARRLGAQLTCLGLPDMAVQNYTPEDATRLAELLLAQAPDVVLTHWPDDTHPDHAAAARLTVDALLRYAVAFGLDDVEASRRAFPHVWACDTYGGLGRQGGFEPEWYVDISDAWPAKCHAIEAHQSQNPAYWIDLIGRQNAFYGYRCNRNHAEGFRHLPLAMVNNMPAHDGLY